MKTDRPTALALAVSKANSPCFLADKQGKVLSYSGFFLNAMHRQPDKTVFDLLPELNFLNYRKIWKQDAPGKIDGARQMELMFAPNLSFPTYLNFLPVSEEELLVLASPLTDWSSLQYILPAIRNLQQTILWEACLITNHCLVSGGVLLQQMGMEKGMHKLTMGDAKRFLRRRLSIDERSQFNEHLKGAMRSGKAFEMEVCPAILSGASLTGKLICQAERSRFSTFKLYGHLELSERPEHYLVQTKEALDLHQPLANESPFPYLLTRSKAYTPVIRQLRQVAPSEATVYIEGETGSGKELLARAIHENSQRNGQLFLKVNCGAIPANLVESYLFGHEKGAFTGAHKDRAGYFKRADGGTLFLDEIGELPLSAQSRLLRVLQEGTFEPVGSTSTQEVDVRIITATNRDLQAMAQSGDFRPDLYFRLCVFPIKNPPLREHREDIPLLVQHFYHQYRSPKQEKIRWVGASDMQLLMEYDFPGNVRELGNLVERALILSEGNTLAIGKSMARK